MHRRPTLVVGVALVIFAQIGLFGSTTALAQDMGSIDSATADQVLPYAEMSQSSYRDQWAPIDTPGWTRVADWQSIFAVQGRSDQINAAASSGFYAAIYQDAKGNITIAYRGTTNLTELQTVDLPAYAGQTPAQYAYARELAILVQKTYPNATITVTGHSLGGALATYAGQQVPGISQVITFNAARASILSSVTRGGTSQINIVVAGDPVGDPKTGSVAGLGSLPGKLYYVNSTTYIQQDSLSRTEGIWRPQDSHSLDGIAGGLNQVANSSSTSTPKPTPLALPQTLPGTIPQAPQPSSNKAATQSPSSAPLSSQPSSSPSTSTSSTPTPATSGLVKSTNPNLQMYSFKPLPNGNIEIYENGRPISSGGGFSLSQAQGLGYSPPPSQPAGASGSTGSGSNPAGGSPSTTGLVQSTNPNLQMYSFKPLANGNVEIYDKGKPISAGGGFSVSQAQALGYSPLPSQQTPAPTSAASASVSPAASLSTYTFAPTQYGTIQVSQNGKIVATTTPQLAAQHYGYRPPNTPTPTPVPAPITSGYATTPSGAVVNVATGQLVSAPPNVSPAPSSPSSQSAAPTLSTNGSPAQPPTPSSQPIPAPSSISAGTQPTAGAMVQPAQSSTQLALRSPVPRTGVSTNPSLSAGSPAPATPIAPVPGGISLSRAAAGRMPLSIALDASYFDGGKIVLSGKASNQGIDAALFLTALRAACENEDPYFSLDPDDGALWNRQGEQASEILWSRIKPDLIPDLRRDTTHKIGSTIDVQTLSARRDYSVAWREIARNFPNLRSKLVFNPEWLRQTRFGEVLYKADVLLKELSSGISVLTPGHLRAAAIKGYLAADAERAAKSLLAGETQIQPAVRWRGSRLWFDIAQSPPAAFFNSDIKASPSTGDPQISAVLRARGLIRTAQDIPTQAVAARKEGNVVDLSLVNPRMFVRIHDHATRQDLSDHDPDLDGLASDVTKRFDQYAKIYDELRLLREVFRAYIAAINIIDSNDRLCKRLDPLPLFEAEKLTDALPTYHPTELFITVATYKSVSRVARQLRSAVASSLNGGVSISGRRLSETELREEQTPVTRAVLNRISQGNLSDDDGSGRVFVLLTLDDALATPPKLAPIAGPTGARSDPTDYEIENEPPVQPLRPPTAGPKLTR